MVSIILCRSGKALLPLLAERVPNHADTFQPPHLFCVQAASGLLGALVRNPASQRKIIFCFPIYGHHKVAVLGIILRGFFIAFCPGQVAVVVPAHTDAVQAFNLLLGQAPDTLAAANLPLNLQPCAKAQAHGRLVAPRNVQVAVFGIVNASLGEVVVPCR